MKVLKSAFLNGSRHELAVIVMLLSLTFGCGSRTNETASKTLANNEKVKEEVIDDRYFGGCGRFRNTKGDKAYMSVTHTEGEKKLEGICFGRNVNQPLWTGTFTGEVVSADAYLFEIDVNYQINGETVQVKEKWEKVNNITFQLVESEPNRPELTTKYLLVNCINEFPEQQGFIERNSVDYSHIKAAKKYYKAIDVNGSVIIELKYYEGIPEVTGTMLGKVGENEMWSGLITGNLIDGRIDSLRVTVEYFESGDEYYKSSQTWYIDEFSSLNIVPDHNDNKPGWAFMPIDLPNGFPDKETFEKTYMDYHNEID